MAFRNKSVSNAVTGQDILFLQTAKDTNGQLLEMETTYHSYSAEPPMHYHPCQEEDFTVLSGELTVRIHGGQRILQQGDTLHIGKNTAHAMWNKSGNKTIVRWQVRPSMNTEHLLETIYGLAMDGKTNSRGIPPLLQTVLIANRYAPVFRLTKPPYNIQKVLFALLTPLSLALGYRAVYKKYID